MQYMKINFLELNVPLYNAQIQLLCFLFPQFYGSQLNGIIIIINVIIIINITIKFFYNHYHDNFTWPLLFLDRLEFQ